MKIAFFGTGDFSRNILKGIMTYPDIIVKLVVSQPDKPVGRKKILTPTQVKEFGVEKKLEVCQPVKLRGEEEFLEKLQSLELDFIVVVAYGKIIPESILNIPKHGSINIHGSLLPKYRGASPIQECLKNGDKETGLTIMYMSKGMDEGDSLSREKIKIDIVDNTMSLFQKFEQLGPSLLISTLRGVIAGEIKGVKQDNNKATYCSKISKTDGKVDFCNDTLTQIYNKYRAYNPWPGIYTMYEGKKLDIIECEIFSGELGKNVRPGEVVKIDKKNIGIVTADKKLLILRKLKLESKKTMDILSFVNGNKDFLTYKFQTLG